MCWMIEKYITIGTLTEKTVKTRVYEGVFAGTHMYESMCASMYEIYMDMCLYEVMWLNISKHP